MKPAFFGLQNYSSSKNPILIIDRMGLIGEPLSLRLAKEFPVVFVSRSPSASVSFSGKFPVIPDGKYSHIIFIDEEGLDMELLSGIITKAKEVNADFIFAQGLSEERKYAVDRILKQYSSAKVILFGDIFNKELIVRREVFKSVVNKFIYQAQSFGRIQVVGEGLRETYPVFLQDVVDGLIDLVFGIHKSHSLFYLFPKHPPSELSLAHMIQKANPEITVDFVRHDPRFEKITYPSKGKHLLDGEYALAKKIRKIDIKNKAKIKDESPRGNARKLRRFPFFMIWLILFLLISPLVFTILFSMLGLNTFYYAKGEMEKGNFTNSKSSFHLSRTFFSLGKQTSNVLFFQAKVLGLEDNLKRLSQDLELGYKISESLSQTFNSGDYFFKIISGKSKDPRGDLAIGQNFFKNSIFLLEKTKAEGKIPAPILENIEIANPLVRLLFNTEDIMSDILGMENPKTYLILFQNNLELRPGGGIVDAYGILKLDMGKITEFSVHDVDDADKQLRGHVEPPFAIRRHLPSEHWYMKDSSFDADFVKSASSSSNFLFVETGRKADGVIGMDVSFVKSILQAIGPVYVAGYKKIVDEGNLYALMQSRPDKKFLKSLYETIIAKTAKEKTHYLLVAQAISDSLSQKHLVLTSKDWQNILTVNGWSSSLWDERRGGENIVNDFMGISEANLGENKVNYFIKRQVLQKIAIGDGKDISEELTISYKNESATPSGSEYKNYLRIILPQNVKLSEISINDKPQDIVDAVTDPLIYEAKNFKAPQGLEVEKTSEGNKAIFGFIVKVPAGTIVKVKVKYLLENPFGLNAVSYSLKLFKQPGIDSIPYSLTFNYPDDLNIIKKSNGITGGEGRVVYSGRIIEDKNLIINFAEK